MIRFSSIFVLFSLFLGTTVAASPHLKSGEEAFHRLLEGNQRFASDQSLHPGQDRSTLETLREGQNPHTLIFSCSDSRVPPEKIFDLGLGELFTIRTAGGALSDEGIASAEYALQHLNIQLIVFLAHESCGAVAGAVAWNRPPEGSPMSALDRLLGKIRTKLVNWEALPESSRAGLQGAIGVHIYEVAKEFLEYPSEVIQEAVRRKKIPVKLGYFNFSSREVEFL